MVSWKLRVEECEPALREKGRPSALEESDLDESKSPSIRAPSTPLPPNVQHHPNSDKDVQHQEATDSSPFPRRLRRSRSSLLVQLPNDSRPPSLPSSPRPSLPQHGLSSHLPYGSSDCQAYGHCRLRSRARRFRSWLVGSSLLLHPSIEAEEGRLRAHPFLLSYFPFPSPLLSRRLPVAKMLAPALPYVKVSFTI